MRQTPPPSSALKDKAQGQTYRVHHNTCLLKLHQSLIITVFIGFRADTHTYTWTDTAENNICFDSMSGEEVKIKSPVKK